VVTKSIPFEPDQILLCVVNRAIPLYKPFSIEQLKEAVGDAFTFVGRSAEFEKLGFD